MDLYTDVLIVSTMEKGGTFFLSRGIPNKLVFIREDSKLC